MLISRAWAAIRGERAIVVVPMDIPLDVPLDEYRSRVRHALELVGDVKSGELHYQEGKLIFVKRLTHGNRSKNKNREPKSYVYKVLEEIDLS